MEDLKEALTHRGERMAFLGGGNPASIPEAEEIFAQTYEAIGRDKSHLRSILGDYSGPIGNEDLRSLAAEALALELNFPLTKEHIAFFNGSQNAFYFLLNAFSGTMPDGTFRRIGLPIVPEYIGYADQTNEAGVFAAFLPNVEQDGPNRFRYTLNAKQEYPDDLGVLVISRPTNPSGNVLSLREIKDLHSLCVKRKIPFLIDLAYGNPFPNLIGKEEPIHFSPGMVLSLSFSKIGLPGLRFGIVVADPPVIELLSSFAATGNLSAGNIGPAFARIFWKERTLEYLSNHILRPYYDTKLQMALEILEGVFQTEKIDYLIHKPLGGFFVWLYFPSISITNQELYELCKEESVTIVSGHYFFPGLVEHFSHREKCIRLTYCRSEEEIAYGSKILAQLVAKHS